MKTKTYFIGLCISLCAITMSTYARAQHDHHGAGQKPLLDIMRALGDDMNLLNNAVFKDDLKEAKEAARRVAEHPQINAEEMKKISKALGKDMAKFEQWDMAAHEAAAKASVAKSTDEIAKLQGDIVSNCVSCHSQFRNRVQAALKTK